MNELQIVQKWLLKFLFNKDPLTCTNHLHQEIRILKLTDLHKFMLLKFVHDCLNEKTPPTFRFYFKYQSSSYHTRQYRKLDIQRSRLAIGQSRISSIGADLWNKVDNEITSLPNKTSFQNKLMDIYLAQYNM